MLRNKYGIGCGWNEIVKFEITNRTRIFGLVNAGASRKAMRNPLSMMHVKSLTYQRIGQKQQVNKNQPDEIISIFPFHDDKNRYITKRFRPDKWAVFPF